jgi:hypothetical protein
MAGRASRNKWTARAEGERTGVCTYCFSDVAQREKGASSLLGVAAPSLEDDMKSAYPVPQSQEKEAGGRPARVLREDIADKGARDGASAGLCLRRAGLHKYLVSLLCIHILLTFH